MKRPLWIIAAVTGVAWLVRQSMRNGRRLREVNRAEEGRWEGEGGATPRAAQRTRSDASGASA